MYAARGRIAGGERASTRKRYRAIAAGSEALFAEGLERMEREVLGGAAHRLEPAPGGQDPRHHPRGTLRTKIRALGINMAREVWSGEDAADA